MSSMFHFVFFPVFHLGGPTTEADFNSLLINLWSTAPLTLGAICQYIEDTLSLPILSFGSYRYNGPPFSQPFNSIFGQSSVCDIFDYLAFWYERWKIFESDLREEIAIYSEVTDVNDISIPCYCENSKSPLLQNPQYLAHKIIISSVLKFLGKKSSEIYNFVCKVKSNCSRESLPSILVYFDNLNEISIKMTNSLSLV